MGEISGPTSRKGRLARLCMSVRMMQLRQPCCSFLQLKLTRRGVLPSQRSPRMTSLWTSRLTLITGSSWPPSPIRSVSTLTMPLPVTAATVTIARKAAGPGPAATGVGQTAKEVTPWGSAACRLTSRGVGSRLGSDSATGGTACFAAAGPGAGAQSMSHVQTRQSAVTTATTRLSCRGATAVEPRAVCADREVSTSSAASPAPAAAPPSSLDFLEDSRLGGSATADGMSSLPAVTACGPCKGPLHGPEATLRMCAAAPEGARGSSGIMRRVAASVYCSALDW
mmetsp:Transcript_14957/g.38018  ORF Transcript_14957/g.38018 Transcript_14957/m.38018 type:complete len:282 (+) Transcript_14957:94-939(+)